MKIHGFSHISFCDRAKGRRENLTGRGETRKTTDVTLDLYLSRTDYTLPQPKDLIAAHP